ncbi:hypothetical protein SETIT_5G107800v2 [Setaria italica]|nr:hypothetical protein SETIT_5G107800v2 [Setaria italica]
MYQLATPAEIKHGDMAVEEDEEKEWRLDERDKALMVPNLTWEKKVLRVLDMVRCRELIEFNHKLNYFTPTRFCEFNIAFFDLDKESEWRLDDSINVISITVAESELSGTINIYGTVLARDQYDYRCVHLFKRGREDSQPISPKVYNTLTLTGPNQALAGLAGMYFEFHLKVKGEGAVDQDFSKGEPRTLSVESYLSKVDMVYTPVSYAVEASLGINILNGKSNFIGKVIAQTTNDENEIILYDSGVAGTETELGYGGFVKLARSVVAVPRDEKLMLRFTVSGGDHKSLSLLLPRWNSVEALITKLGPYKMQLKIIYKGVLMQRPNLFGDFGDSLVLR